MSQKSFLSLCVQALIKPDSIVLERLEKYSVPLGPLIAMWVVSIIISIPLGFLAWAFAPPMGYLVYFLGFCFYPAYSYGVYTLAKRLGSETSPQNVAYGFAVFNFLPVLGAIVLGWAAAVAKSPPLTSVVLLAVLILGARGRVLSIQAGTGLDAQKSRRIAAIVATMMGIVIGVTALMIFNLFGQAMRKGGY